MGFCMGLDSIKNESNFQNIEFKPRNLKKSTGSIDSSMIQELLENEDSFIDLSQKRISYDHKRLSALEDDIKTVEESIGSHTPSLSEIVDKWGNDELNLLYYEYQTLHEMSEAVWNATSPVNTAIRGYNRVGAAPLKLVGAYSAQSGPMANKVEQSLAALILAFKIPSQLGQLGVLLYKRILLAKAEDLLKKHGSGMSSSEVEDFSKWLTDEKLDVTASAKYISLQFGSSIPKYLNTIIRLCQFNAPYLRLGLTWLTAVIDPLMAAYDLYLLNKTYKGIKKDISEFKQENFQTIFQESLSQEENGQQMLSAVNASIHSVAEQAMLNRRDELLEKRGEFEDDFIAMIKGLNLHQDEDDPLRMRLIEDELEKAGLAVNFSVDSAQELLDLLSQKGSDVYENTLARYIDLHSNKPMADSLRNGLISLNMKKQQISRREALYGVREAAVILAAIVASSIAVVVLVTLFVTGVAAIPAAVLLIPAFGMLGLTVTLMAVGLARFYKNSPNLLVEYLKGTYLKLAVRKIPRAIHSLRMNINAIEICWKKLSAAKLEGRETLTDKEQAKATKLAKQIKRLSEQQEKILTKIADWDSRIDKINRKIGIAKYKDFLGVKPKFTKDNTSAYNAFEGLKEAILKGKDALDEKTKKILKERLGLDCDQELDEAILNRQLWAFAP